MPTNSLVAMSGPVGPQGPIGLTGDTGATGATGPAGAINTRIAIVPTPALAVGDTNIPIVWSSAIPTSTYVVQVTMEGGSGILAALDVIIQNGTRTTTGVTISVRNTTLVPIGAGAANVHVLAVWV